MLAGDLLYVITPFDQVLRSIREPASNAGGSIPRSRKIVSIRRLLRAECRSHRASLSSEHLMPV